MIRLAQAFRGGEAEMIRAVSAVSAGLALVTALVASGCGSTSGQSGLGRLRWEDADPAWSPDSRQIAFDSTRASRDGNLWGVYVIRARGGRPRRVTPLGTDAEDPAWSPDGRSLIYASNLGTAGGSISEHAWLSIIPLRSGNRPRRIVSIESCSEFAWSPTSRWLAVARGDCGGGSPVGSWSLYLIRPNGSGLHELPLSRLSDSLGWSPDGTRVAYDCFEGQLCVYDVSNGSVRQFTHLPSEPFQAVTSIDWSPDGKRIAYIQGTGGSYEPDYHSWIIDADGRRNHRLPRFGEGSPFLLTWIPSRPGWLLASGDVGAHLYIVRSDARIKHDLALTTGPFEGSATVAPDGRTIAYNEYGKAGSALFVASVSGQPRRVTQKSG
jgi:Tol biopolymer transport system component